LSDGTPVLLTHWRNEEGSHVCRQARQGEKSAGQILKDLCGAFLGQLAVIDDRLGLRKLVRWLHDEAGRNATLRELNLLNDHRLDDIGRRRLLDPKADDLVDRL
jgi:hypothetical protein